MEDPVPAGAELARLFHADVVAPLLARELPRLRYAAGRLGSGSDVLGFDDPMSRDHDWGCRLTLLAGGRDAGAVLPVMELLERELPAPAGAVIPFWDRPYRGVDEAIQQSLLAGITDPQVAALPAGVGSVEQWAGSADVLSHPGRLAALRATYGAWAGQG